MHFRGFPERVDGRHQIQRQQQPVFDTAIVFIPSEPAVAPQFEPVEDVSQRRIRAAPTAPSPRVAVSAMRVAEVKRLLAHCNHRKRSFMPRATIPQFLPESERMKNRQRQRTSTAAGGAATNGVAPPRDRPRVTTSPPSQAVAPEPKPSDQIEAPLPPKPFRPADFVFGLLQQQLGSKARR